MKRKYIFYIAFLSFSIFSVYSCAQNTHNIEELSNKNSTYYYNIGMAGLTAQNYAVAISNFKKAILKDPNNYKAYDKLALAYANVGNYKKAIKSIDRALHIKPDYYQAILDKAIILQAEHKTKEAIDTLNKCITNDYCSLRPQAYYQLANIYKSKGDTKDYIKNLNLAILYDRDFNVAKFDLARAYVENNMCSKPNIEEKAIYLIDSEKNNIGASSIPDMLLLKTKCYMEANKFKEASKLIRKILFKEDINQKYKDEAIELSKELITLEYVNKNTENPPISYAESIKKSKPKNQNTIVNNNNKEKETKNFYYYQLGVYYIKEYNYAYNIYIKAKKLGFDTYMVKNNKAIIVFAKVPEDKKALFKKEFPFAFKIKHP
ncbi:Tetratricopeptide TPR_2 repeat protein [Hydrogenobaculum sp. Y04AAS1]|uniref:tetratricopeptide repeat protein n=1 Tax=Hydrogenobaculum sp. (strain Y04AAS1) TaxID=380749 RepID=UPI00015BCF8F|nr:Tetratricopeptide TPR_2 repeat protein [Hydrogenobaculum sp. Y04AAS1]